MSNKNLGETQGVAIRGADGNLYFVPTHVLQTYKVPEAGAATLGAKIPQGHVAANTTISTEWMMQVAACFIGHG